MLVGVIAGGGGKGCRGRGRGGEGGCVVLTMEVEEDGYGQGYLQKEECGDADGEFAVEGFVSEEVHGEECAGAAPEGCEEQECGLGGAAA